MPASQGEAPPLLSALFVVRFDQRAGYTLSWSKSLPGLSLVGVEFKSLPSGLHNVRDDLVYFTQADTHAGLSAFRNDEASAADRHASFACVGALVLLNGSRLGRIWLHGPEIRRLAGLIQGNASNTTQLEKYWEEHKAAPETDQTSTTHPEQEQEQPQPKAHEKTAHGRRRALSESTNLASAAPSTFHPAHSTSNLLEAFGPLLFPLYRATLLRKRILIIRKPSVQTSCDFVYLLSIISSIPSDIDDAILANAPTRSKPMFSIGITEIPELEQSSPSASQTRKPRDSDDPDADAITDEGERVDENGGWLACTTDELLAMKSQLYDLKVEFPGVGSMATRQQQQRSWPLIIESASTSLQQAGVKAPEIAIRASPRDGRRFKALRQGLRRMTRRQRYTDEDNENLQGDDVSDDDEPLLRPDSNETEHTNDTTHVSDPDEPIVAEREAVEPSPWAAIAYDSFVWWASAGERSIEVDDEALHYRELLSSAATDGMHYGRHGTDDDDESNKIAAMVVGYFHRWTSLILSTLADLVEEAEGSVSASAGGGGEDEAVVVMIGKDELMTMGLDAWSTNDRHFVRELCRLYFGVEASVDGRSVECCGVRVL